MSRFHSTAEVSPGSAHPGPIRAQLQAAAVPALTKSCQGHPRAGCSEMFALEGSSIPVMPWHCSGGWAEQALRSTRGTSPQEPRTAQCQLWGGRRLHCLHCGHCSRCQPCQERAISSDLSAPAMSSIRDLQERGGGGSKLQHAHSTAGELQLSPTAC